MSWRRVDVDVLPAREGTGGAGEGLDDAPAEAGADASGGSGLGLLAAAAEQRGADTGEAASLACASDQLDGPCILSYGDILFRPHILENLLSAKGNICAVITT